jgi:hypothetical protein
VGRLSSDNVLQVVGTGQDLVAGQKGFRPHSAAAAFGSPLVLYVIDGLSGGHYDQQSPEIVAVRELGKSSVLDASTQAIEDAQGHVFFVGYTAWMAAKPLSTQSHKLREITLPELLGGKFIAGLDFIEPTADRSFGSHGDPLAGVLG